MGRSKKRKKKDTSCEESSETSEQNSSHSTMSSILSAVNGVLYGSPPRTGSGPSTSTPAVEKSTVRAQTDAENDLSVHQKLDWIMSKLQQLDVLEESVKRTNAAVTMLEQRVTNVELQGTEHEKAVVFVSAKVDEFEQKCQKIDDLSDKLRKQETTLFELQRNIDQMRNEREVMSDTIVDLQCRSMKDNLIFTGLCGESNTEDTESKVREFINVELGVDSGRIAFGNVHRYGRFNPGRPRPIVARFVHHRDLITVKENAYKLARSPFGINEQYPAVIEDRRRQLYPVVKRLKRGGANRVKLVRDRLYVNGKPYDERLDHERMDAQPSTSHTVSHSVSQGDRVPSIDGKAPAHPSNTHPARQSTTQRDRDVVTATKPTMQPSAPHPGSQRTQNVHSNSK